MYHLVCLRQRIIRAQRIIRHKDIDARFLRKLQSLLNLERTRCAHHAASDDKQIRALHTSLVHNLNDRKAHYGNLSYIKVRILKNGDLVLGIRLSFLRDKILGARAFPHLLQTDELNKPLQKLVLETHNTNSFRLDFPSDPKASA